MRLQRKYVKKPGDVFVYFEPITKEYDNPMHVLQKGMTHAGLVVENRQGKDLFFPQKDGEHFSCHLDTSSGWDPSGCLFDQAHHFVRIENDSPQENKDAIIDIANNLYQNWTYDAFFNLDTVDQKSLDQMSQKLNTGEKTNLYCAELPYTVHSVSQNKLIFPPTTFGKTIEEYNDFVEKYGNLFDNKITKERSVDSVIEYFNNFYQTKSLLDNGLVKSFVRASIMNPNGVTASMAGISNKKLASMWAFIEEAKRKGSNIHYIGSYIPNSYKIHSVL